jgi:hypothetical protein
MYVEETEEPAHGAPKKGGEMRLAYLRGPPRVAAGLVVASLRFPVLACRLPRPLWAAYCSGRHREATNAQRLTLDKLFCFVLFFLPTYLLFSRVRFFEVFGFCCFNIFMVFLDPHAEKRPKNAIKQN